MSHLLSKGVLRRVEQTIKPQVKNRRVEQTTKMLVKNRRVAQAMKSLVQNRRVEQVMKSEVCKNEGDRGNDEAVGTK